LVGAYSPPVVDNNASNNHIHVFDSITIRETVKGRALVWVPFFLRARPPVQRKLTARQDRLKALPGPIFLFFDFHS
jgi:hypothetical protein